MDKINAAAELFLTTSKEEYKTILLSNEDVVSNNIENFSEVVEESLQNFMIKNLQK